MKVKNVYDQVSDMSAEDLTRTALSAAGSFVCGELETLKAEVVCLGEIVARLVGRLPENEWLEVLALQAEFKSVK